MEDTPLLSITEATFEVQVLRSAVPVLVEFGASWCALCRTMEPHLQALAREGAGTLVVGKVDVDGEGVLADRFDVRSLPTLLLFRDGTTLGRIVGAVPMDKLREFLVSAGAMPSAAAA